jgi:hypothetical protein
VDSLAAAARANARASMVVLLYVALRVFAARDVSPGFFPDTAAYKRIASLPLASGTFFRGTKPWGVAFLSHAAGLVLLRPDREVEDGTVVS